MFHGYGYNNTHSRMKALFQKPYLYWILGIFVVYMALNSFFSGFYELALQIPYFVDTINWTALTFSLLFATLIGFLLALNITVVIKEYKEKKKILKKQSFLSTLGLVAGFSTGICTLCITGLFPFLFALFGITFTWAFLPFGGMEIQFLTIAILSLSLFLIVNKKQNCEVKL